MVISIGDLFRRPVRLATRVGVHHCKNRSSKQHNIVKENIALTRILLLRLMGIGFLVLTI